MEIKFKSLKLTGTVVDDDLDCLIKSGCLLY